MPSFPWVITKPPPAKNEEASAEVDDQRSSEFAEFLVKMITILGGVVLVFATVLAIINLCLVALNSLRRKWTLQHFMPFDRDVGAGPATITRLRLQLSQLIALGLEILLIGDIVETLVRSSADYTFDDLFKLAIVASIRTLLSYFLGLETKEILERAKEDGEEKREG
ncbi:hypothetical protein CTAYLR_005353 [Chrysophaeum taylorii]|uniref:DUF1622 domain-containing protein n=1 Tax=Chrysophaeum taylorii TaxID=2483200 RepID=A0AAD7U6T9_9STRA|nr:hypothetical protein CTAYLR_005353 [Chrysophaeum taylorii]